MADVADFAVLESPHGPIHAAVTKHGVCALAFRTTTEAFRSGLTRIGRADRRGHLAQLESELDDYWAGRRLTFDVPLDLTVRSAWDRRVLEVVRSITCGRTMSYGEVARRAGSPGAARAVGGAVGRNPIGLLIPCHRVIAADGTLGGYGGSWLADAAELLALKRALLAGEGVAIPS
ncbi:MAG TPA: methylated-DNA--[protein]-cysteine S-methyltransferase [Candidatus Limnocylindrales bacterium]|nr:methylated-DNA--[protein]-cysteine S-methyltransferase [Candidatus Limnocylindrales bacterium]